MPSLVTLAGVAIAALVFTKFSCIEADSDVSITESANCPSGGMTCAAAKEALLSQASLSMLQVAASSDDVHHRRPSSAKPAAAPVDLPISPLRVFKSVNLLVVQLPLSDAFRKQAAGGGVFGEHKDVKHGGFALDPGAFAELRIAHYPDAPIGWSGTYGESDPINVPHHLLSIRVPILQGTRKLCQTVFALTDDDTAMMILRMSSGIPAKLANMSFPGPNSIAEGGEFNATRRALEIVEAVWSHDLGSVPTSEAEPFFSRPEVNYGTDMSNFEPLSQNMVYKKLKTKPDIFSVQRAKVGLKFADGSHDGVAWMIGDASKPLDAWWIQADLEVTTTLVPVARPKDLPTPPVDQVISARMLGEVVTGKKRKPQQFPRMAYTNGDVVWFRSRLNTNKAATYLPPGLTLAAEEGIVWHVRWDPADPANSWGARDPGDWLDLEYNELWVTLPVSYRGKQYVYPVLMLLDDDVAEVMGQDGAGCPKKLANITFTLSNGGQTGSDIFLEVTRHGRQVLEFSGKVTSPVHTPVPGINANQNPNGQVVWLFSHQFAWNPAVDRPRYMFTQGQQRTQSQKGMTDVRIALGSEPSEPLGDWFQGPPLEAGYIKMDQDWLPSMSTPISSQLSQPDPEEFAEWWKRVYPVLYM